MKILGIFAIIFLILIIVLIIYMIKPIEIGKIPKKEKASIYVNSEKIYSEGKRVSEDLEETIKNFPYQ